MYTTATPQQTVSAPSHARYIPAFDGIRGVSVLWVMMFHFVSIGFAYGGGASHPGHWIAHLAEVGWVGVQIFFALSGFLITGILFDSLGDPHFFRNFYARRTLRIFPLYYGLLAFLLILTPILHLNWHGRAWVWPLYLQFTIPVNSGLASYLNIVHLWSLAIEEQFYLFWPLLVFLLKDIRKLLAAASLLSLAGLVSRIALCYPEVWGGFRVYMPCQLDALLIGGIGALLLRTHVASRLLRLAPALFVLATLPLIRQFVVGRLTYESNRSTATFGFTIMAFATTALLLWSMQAGSLASRAFSFAPLRFVGRYSYGIYIIHNLLVALLQPIARIIRQVGSGYGLSVALSCALVTAVSIALAYLSYVVYERPFLRLKRYFVPARPAEAASVISAEAA